MTDHQRQVDRFEEWITHCPWINSDDIDIRPEGSYWQITFGFTNGQSDVLIQIPAESPVDAWTALIEKLERDPTTPPEPTSGNMPGVDRQ